MERSVRAALALAGALFLTGCIAVRSDSPPILECPVIESRDFPIKELPTERPRQPEHVEPWFLEAEDAYLSCRDAVDGYREILERARRTR